MSMKRLLFTLFAFSIVAMAHAGNNTSTSSMSAPKEKKQKLENGMYAEFTTSKGVILIQLEFEKTPMTVANFVGLAEGKFTVEDSIKYTTPFYNGLKFHRVIADFMIQGGDPQGNGSSGPKHRFYDEIDPTLTHSGPGILSMANSGPNTNGSQFFITHKETPWLDGKHTVFGHVISGQDIVNAIAQDDIMTSVKIIRVGKVAKKWNATEQFAEVYNKIKVEQMNKEAEFKKIAAMSQEEYSEYMFTEYKKIHPDAKKSASGLVYVIENEGEGNKPSAGSKCSVHYTGTFRTTWEKFDSSRDRGAPMDFQYLVQRMVPGFEEGIGMLGKGGKAIIVIPYYAAYGAQGRPGAIPPYSDLVFDIEMVDLQVGSIETHHDHDGHDHGDHDGHNH